MILFETPRLQCRRLVPGDEDALFAVYGDADAMRWVGDGRPITRAECRRWLEVTDANVRTRGYGMCTLVARDAADAGPAASPAPGSEPVVGFCGLVHPGGQEEVEIKYALRREHWGRGLASEAVAGMLAWARERLGIDRVIATVAPANTASLRVLAKAGMRPVALRRNDDGSTTQVLDWHAR